MTKKVVRKKKGKRKSANGDYIEKYEAMMYYTLRYDPSATEPYCHCPGHDERCIELLVIDHKKKRTKKEKGLTGKSFYKYLKENNYPEGYQVLCFSCNFVKELYNGKCPHLFEKYRKKKATEFKSTKKKAAKKTKKKRRERSR